jgi:ribokinase
MPTGSLAPLRRKRIVVLPDTYIDAIVRMPAWAEARPRFESTIANGGGNIPVGPIELKLGGNGANLAVALARLGAQVDFITETDRVGMLLLEEARRFSNLNLRGVRLVPHAATTLALEFERANLMLSHAGPVASFGPGKLTKEQWALIEQADAVAIVNWAQNQKGTQLLASVAKRAKEAGAFVFVDTADPRHRAPSEIKKLLGHRSLWRSVDAWGMNENEVRAFSGDQAGPVLALAKNLSRRFSPRLDLHTRHWAASCRGGSAIRVEAHADKPRRLTGAGDAWNAGNLAGYLLDWQTAERLEFAHLVATKYVTGRDGRPPQASDFQAKSGKR